MRKLFFLSFALAAAIPAFSQVTPAVLEAKQDAVSRLSGHQPGVQFMELGTQLERVYGPPFGGGATADEAFQMFVAGFGDVFSPGDARFVYRGKQELMRGKFFTGTFDQFWGPYPVDKGELTLLARNDVGFPIVLAVNNAKTLTGPLPRARISANAAISALKAVHRTLNKFEKPSLVIWMGETKGHLAWSFHADGAKQPDPSCKGCGDIPERVLAFVDAQTGQVLEERQAIWTIDVDGNVSGWASPGLKPDNSVNPPAILPMPNLRANISGGNFAYSNSAGNFTIPHSGSAPVTVNAPLTSQWTNVVNQAGATISMSQNVTPPGPANFIFNAAPAQFTTAQVNGYIHTNLVHDFVKSVNPAYPGIDITIPCNVNVSGSCNAFFTTSGGPSINFYQAATTGTPCPNMAYSTVVYHEYGHFVINRAGTGQGAYGEGMSDTIANLLADHPWTGEDFRGPNTGPLRSAINPETWPSSSPIHTAGRIVSGAFWLTLLELDNTIGHTAGLQLIRELAINSILLHPPGISPGMTVDVLTLDDNDADLTNGTPHYSEIAAGFGAKGLHAPLVQWVKFTAMQRPPVFVGPTYQRIMLVYQITDNVGVVDPSTAKVVYRNNNGSWIDVPMTWFPNQQTGVGIIPTPPNGTVIDWYVEAKDTQGRVTRSPLNAPTDVAQIIVANGLQVLMEDTFETDLGWSVSNTSVTAGAWTRADPNGTNLNGAPANPEDDSDDPGAQCWFTGQGTVGGAVGTQDLDGGPTILTSPLLDVSGGDAIIEYRRWFFNDDGDDTFVVEVSNNNGSSWQVVETVAGTQNSWVKRKFRLSDYVGGTNQVRIRFRTSDNPNNSITEAGVDHVVVRKLIL